MAFVTNPLDLPAHRILVVAPHPDDESLGCGGLITMLSADRRKVKVVFVTDGGASHTGSRDWPRRRLVVQRRGEALAALGLLGVASGDAYFLGLDDANMPALGSVHDQRAVDAVSRLISSFEPDLVLLPWRRDPHRDHRDTWRLTQEAMSRACPVVLTLEYAVWLDELGVLEDQPTTVEAERVIFDITPAMKTKRLAVAAHLSQTSDLIQDDPAGFRLAPETIDRLCGPQEIYWRPLP